MSTLTCQLRTASPVRIAEEFQQPESVLAGLQKLVGGSLAPETGEADVIFRASAGNRYQMRFDDARGTLLRTSPVPKTPEALLSFWRTASLFVSAAKALRGEKAQLMHGCLLQMPDKTGVFLCGQSGMGKSTTAGRWTAAGGVCPADDMILIEYGGETLYAHPMPTWSRGYEVLQNAHYPLENAIPLRAVLALSRDEEKEEIRVVDGFRYMTAIYASCAFFHLDIAKKLNAAHQQQLLGMVKGCAEMLYERFPHRMLFANLKNDITQTLGGF